jgi:SAM-dependent methyltransferase
VATHPTWLPPLLRGGKAPPSGDFHAGRFEGLYGGAYDRVIQNGRLRRLAPLAYGDVGPLPDLEGFAARVASSVPDGGVLLDVPCGGGTLLPLLARAGYRGRVIEADLGSAMLARADRMRSRVAELDVALLQADAQDMPLRDASVAAAVSLNGLHVMPDPAAFVAELGRVIEPGGSLWMITLVSRGTLRADVLIATGRISGILPGAPPQLPAVQRFLDDAGFDVEWLGGEGIVGLRARKGV